MTGLTNIDSWIGAGRTPCTSTWSLILYLHNDNLRLSGNWCHTVHLNLTLDDLLRMSYNWCHSDHLDLAINDLLVGDRFAILTDKLPFFTHA